MISFYEVLRVSPVASQAEIRAAYRRLALAVHPDKLEAQGKGIGTPNSDMGLDPPMTSTASNSIDEKFQSIQNAWQVLACWMVP